MKKLLFLFFFASISFASFAQTDTLVTNKITLNGSNSNDNGNVNGGIVKYQWTQISGATTDTLSGVNTPLFTAALAESGIYQFQLTVTNKAGLTDSQVMQVTMLPGDNRPHAVILALPYVPKMPNK